MEARVPVTLLTGFLGSGKTTVLNTLLRHPGFVRTAVIVNEFGQIGLDHELVLSSTESLVLLQSGCMCCALRGDLLETLIELAERRKAGELDFERVVIETSGLADPAPILHTLLTNRALSEYFAIDGVVTTVDATTGRNALCMHDEARRQVALADLVLLTKTDLPEAETEATRQDIAQLNPGVAVDRIIQGAVQPDRLMSLGHFDLTMKSQAAREWLRQDAGANLSRPGHLNDIRTVLWTMDLPLSDRIFDIWMDLLMAWRGKDILRFKGLIHLEGQPCPLVVHGVQHIFHPPVRLQDWRGDDRRTKLVMIVRNFTDAEVEELYMALRLAPPIEHSLPAGYLSAGGV